jgi:hypothetical protein
MFSSNTANGKTLHFVSPHICASQDRKREKMQNMKEEEKGRRRKKI